MQALKPERSTIVALQQVNKLDKFTEEGNARRPIDLVHLAKQSLGDPGLEEEILRMFEQMIGTYMGRVRECAPVGDVRLDLHALKGAAAGVGARAIVAMAVDAEAEISPQGHLGAERVADLGMAVEEARAFIIDLLDD